MKPPATGHAPSVGVVVLNWNAAWFTLRCLRALLATDHPPDRLHLVVADNGSVDGSAEVVERFLAERGAAEGGPSVELLRNGANLGFAEGCNRAVRRLLAPGPDRVDFVALVNNDAWPEPTWLSELLSVAEGHERCGAVSARLVLEPEFVAVPVVAGEAGLELTSAEVDLALPDGGSLDFDVLGRVRTDGFADEGALEWPARRIWQLAPAAEGTVWVPAPTAATWARLTLGELKGDAQEHIEVDLLAADRVTLLNGVGTALNEVGEGYDIGYGRPDVPTAPTVVDGFCGGAALLRADALDRVGLFDPRFFAYYEDTDLSWRLRNAGWEIRTAPAAVVHHAFGAAGGGGSRLHVFLDRRNWLATNLRNADATGLRHCLGWLRRGSWRLFRVNVFGRLRRGRRAQWQPLLTWKAAGWSAIAALPRTLATRSRPVGTRPTSRVRTLLQPGGRPPRPVPWPGGPLVVYLDVGETLKAGYRAGIQRVVCGLAAALPTASEDLEVVPVRYCERNRRFRRVTADEYASLMRAGGDPSPPPGAPAVARGRDGARRILDRMGVLGAARAGRELVFGRRRRAVEDSLVLDRLEAGAVLLEADAVWNELQVDRAELLTGLRADGVRIAVFVHDLLPLERPEWFSPHLHEIFDPVARAQLAAAELVLCASDATAASVRAELGASSAPPVVVVPLGVDAIRGDETAGALPADLVGQQYLLVVGTVEPRKNHQLAIDVFDALAGDHPGLHLVVAGRYGWGPDDVAERLRAHPAAGDRVQWLDDVHDDALDALYRHAVVVLVPSHSEGFGLPTVEALGRGVPVVSSTGGALPESAGGRAALVDPGDRNAWVAEVRRLLEDPAHHAEAVRLARSADPPAWDEAAAAFADALTSRFGSVLQVPPRRVVG